MRDLQITVPRSEVGDMMAKFFGRGTIILELPMQSFEGFEIKFYQDILIITERGELARVGQLVVHVYSPIMKCLYEEPSTSPCSGVGGREVAEEDGSGWRVVGGGRECCAADGSKRVMF